MTVAALILATGNGDDRALARLVDAAWSGGAHPILVAGLPLGAEPPTPARATSAADPAAAAAEAAVEVRGTSALILLPGTHAGVDPESITTLIAAHGRAPQSLLAAAHDEGVGPIRLIPIRLAATSPALVETSPVPVETGDEAVVTPSDGADRLHYSAPPADRDTVDPWEQRGETTANEER